MVLTGTFKRLIAEAKACTICAAHLPLGPHPVFQIHPSARILIAGQAPGGRVHTSGVPFDDASGERLRSWMGVTRETFYDAEKIAIMPMGCQLRWLLKETACHHCLIQCLEFPRS